MTPTDLDVRPLRTDQVRVAACTHVGLLRDRNEDAHAVDTERGLFIVADGMGGHPAGDVASRIAVDACLEELTPGRLGRNPVDALLQDVLRSAHQAIRDDADEHPDRAGMGTTIVAAHIDAERTLTVGHVGDSRIYLWASGGLRVLTQDHSLPGKRRNVLTQALGTRGPVSPDTTTHVVDHGDRFLLCTDGLTSMLGDAEIGRTLGRARDVDDACARLVTCALEAGGRDNVTAVVVEIA